jgi:hypothetical protein
MDHVFNMMEQYATNLEQEVESRTKELVEEKKKSDVLLYRMMPRQVSTLPCFIYQIFFKTSSRQIKTRPVSRTGSIYKCHNILFGCCTVYQISKSMHTTSGMKIR